MEAILLAISPLIIAGITWMVKPSSSAPIFGFRKTAIRFGVALLSFGAVVGSAFLAGVEVDALSIETMATAFLEFVGATGIYYLSKKS